MYKLSLWQKTHTLMLSNRFYYSSLLKVAVIHALLNIKRLNDLPFHAGSS